MKLYESFIRSELIKCTHWKGLHLPCEVSDWIFIINGDGIIRTLTPGEPALHLSFAKTSLHRRTFASQKSGEVLQALARVEQDGIGGPFHERKYELESVSL